jgi:hypothetical protein
MVVLFMKLEAVRGHDRATAYGAFNQAPPVAQAALPGYDPRPMATEQRPSFAESFPRHPDLDALVDAFVRGDYARVRLRAAHVIASSKDPAVRRAAALVVERTSADPVATLLLVLCAILIAVVGGWWIASGGPPSVPRPS